MERKKISITDGEIHWNLRVKEEIYNRFMKKCKRVPMSEQMALIAKIAKEVNS